MSRALRTVALIAGSVALIATGVGAVAGGTIISKTAAAAAVGTAKAATAGTLGALTGTIATVAGLTAGVAAIGAQLTAPKPVARGSPAQVVIDVEPPRPYLVGEVMTGGTLRYDDAYGATQNRVPNPLRWQVRVLSGVGTTQAILGHFFDFAPVSSFYNTFFGTVQNLGDRPQATALVPPLGAGAPGWPANSRLSGCTHVGLNFRFDRDGERFAAGLPVYTALCQGEKVYDPRQDSTFPGGSGPCRAGDETTYVYSRNPACHAATYALGRFQAGKRIFGLGQPFDTIDWAAVVDWANDCDSNNWTVNMRLDEGGTGADLRAQRVRNLDDLCMAGGGRWFQTGALLSFDWYRPRIALATLRDEDILEAGGGTDAVPTVRDRMNGVRPQYISPTHNWQQITAREIIGSTYRAEDGTALTKVWPLNGVTNPVQAGQIATYAMADSREIGPMDVRAKVDWRFYRPGDCIDVDSSLIAYQGQAVINQRSLNPETLAVALQLKSETPGKHPFALGEVATPPPTPVLAQTAEERDLLVSAALRPREIDAEFGSTRNQDGGGNMIREADTLAGALYQLGAGAAVVSNQPMAQLVGAPFSAVLFGYVPVRGGERLFFGYTAHSDVSNSDSIRGGYNWRDANGNVFAVDLPQTAMTGTEAVGFANEKNFGEFVNIPAEAIEIQFYVIRPTWGWSGSFFVRRPIMSRNQPGADITASISGPADVVLNYTFDNQLNSTLPILRTYRLALAGEPPITSGVTWRVSVVSGAFVGTAPSIAGSGAGQLSINSGLVTGEALLRITATLAGRTFPPFEVRAFKQFAAPPVAGGGGGGNLATQGITSFNSSTFAVISGPLQITLGSGVTQANLAASAQLELNASSPTGSTTCQWQWQRETSPGVWAVVGSPATSDPNPSVFFDGESGFFFPNPGNISCPATATGLAAGSTQRFRLMGRISAGNVRLVHSFGTASVSA